MDMSQSRRSVFDSAPLYSYMLIKRHALPMCEGAALHLRSRSVNIRRRRTFGEKAAGERWICVKNTETMVLS